MGARSRPCAAPRGRLVFLTNSTLVTLCYPDVGPAVETLQRPQFGMYRIQWPNEEGIEYHLGHGEWMRLLHRNGFEVEDLIEVQAPADAQDHPYYNDLSADWARRWPAEDVWVARKRG